MERFSVRSSKTLLLFAGSVILAAVTGQPVVYAQDTLQPADSVMVQQEKVETVESHIVFHLEKELEEQKEETHTVLNPLSLEDGELSGVTVPAAQVRIIFVDKTERTAVADEEGKFAFPEVELLAGDEISVKVTDDQGTLLEELVFVATEEAVTQEPVEEDQEEEMAEENTELPAEESAEKPVEESTEESAPNTEPVEEAGETPASSTEPAAEEPAAPAEEVKPAEQAPALRSFSLMAAPVADKKATTYYYVKAGDSLYSIASSFKVTVADMMRWNKLTDANKLSAGQILSVDGTNEYSTYNKETVTFTSNKQFLDYVSKYAKEIAADYNLYASLMIAQASLETGYGQWSSLASDFNNLFGIKAQDGYTGNKIVMRTWEEVNGQKVYVDDYFRFYPSYYESFIDYAEKLRNGVGMWDKSFYSGVWTEKTNNFKDATLFLTGRYATDSRYYFKLNDLIIKNNLTQYDEKAYKDTTYQALVISGNYPIGNLPLNHLPSNNANYKNIKTVGNTNDYVGSILTVTHVTLDGQYANVYLNGTELGWVSTQAITSLNLSVVNVNFNSYFTSKTGKIYSLPLGQAGTKEIGSTGNWLNRKLRITSQTADGLQSYVTADGVGLGWVRTSDLGQAVTPYQVVVTSGAYHVDDLPWGTDGFKKLANTSAYMGKDLQVIGKNKAGNYLLLAENGTPVGWVDVKAVTPFTYSTADYSAYIGAGQYNVDTLPWGTPGFVKLGTTAQYLGKMARITRVSTDGAYVYASVDGKGIGWIDKKALGLSGNKYTAIVTAGNYNVDTLPWGTPGFQKLGLTQAYIGQVIDILGATQNGAYLLASVNGKEIGWIDVRAVRKMEAVDVQYDTYVTGDQYEINSQPWGEPGFQRWGMTADILGKKVTITKESSNRAYAYAQGIGWIDKRALGFASQPYQAVIHAGQYNVDTLPWGTPGFKKLKLTSAYYGKSLEIVGATQNGSYLLARVNGKDIGWIDKRAVAPLQTTVLNEKKTVKNGKYEVDCLPWGVAGFQKLGTTANLVGKSLQLTLESPDKAYVYAFLNGQAVGWIDRRAFQ